MQFHNYCLSKAQSEKLKERREQLNPNSYKQILKFDEISNEFNKVNYMYKNYLGHLLQFFLSYT